MKNAHVDDWAYDPWMLVAEYRFVCSLKACIWRCTRVSLHVLHGLAYQGQPTWFCDVRSKFISLEHFGKTEMDHLYRIRRTRHSVPWRWDCACSDFTRFSSVVDTSRADSYRPRTPYVVHFTDGKSRQIWGMYLDISSNVILHKTKDSRVEKFWKKFLSPFRLVLGSKKNKIITTYRTFSGDHLRLREMTVSRCLHLWRGHLQRTVQ